jgi:hypothetical protein
MDLHWIQYEIFHMLSLVIYISLFGEIDSMYNFVDKIK